MNKIYENLWHQGTLLKLPWWLTLSYIITVLPNVMYCGWFIQVCFCLIATKQKRAPAYLKQVPAWISAHLFKQAAASFHLRNSLLCLDKEASVRNNCPPIKTGGRLFSNIAYSNFILDIWSLFLHLFIWFVFVSNYQVVDGHLFINRLLPILK